MLHSILVAGAIASAPGELKAIPTSVSLFKNGFAVVVREAKFGASGDYTLDELPPAVLGTLWITASRGVKLDEVVVGNKETEVDRPVGSLDEILQANVGKVLTFRLSDNRMEIGKLLSATGSVCIIERSTGGTNPLLVLQKGAIAEIESDTKLIYTLKSKTTKRIMRMRANTPGSGSLYILSLERGASWAPGYSVDISDPKTVKVVSKATIINDTLPINGIEARLVTGFPNVPFVRWMDPFTSGQSLIDFANSLMGMGSPADFRRDAGGFGGGGQMMQNRLAERSFDEAFNTSTLGGLTAEDLFFYRLPNVRLMPGERGYYILFSAQADYRHVYELDLPDTIQDTRYVGIQPGQEVRDVWHSLKFKNTSKQPFTTGAATVMKDGEILGQDMMMYTSAEAEATVRITKALDVRVDDDEEEIERKREELKIRSGHYDLVTLKGTIQIANRKSEAVTLEITKTLTGEVKVAEANPKITSIAKGLRAVNPRQKLEWKIDLKPGDKKTVTYTYTVYINN